MEFLSRTQVITALGAVLLVLFVLDLVRRRRLSEDFSLLWVAASIAIAVMGFSTPVLKLLTRSLGVMFESSTVFLVGLGFAVAMLLYLSVRVSHLVRDRDRLTREVALLRGEVERLQSGAQRG